MNELYKVSKVYFSFESNLKIDVKDNRYDQNYPIITLIIDLPSLQELNIFTNLSSYLDGQRDVGSYVLPYKEVEFHNKRVNCSFLPDNDKVPESEYLNSLLVDCLNKNTSRHLYDRRFINKIEKRTNISFNSPINEVQIPILKKSLGWYAIGPHNPGPFVTYQLDINRIQCNDLGTFLKIERRFEEDEWPFDDSKVFETVKSIAFHSQPVPHFAELTSLELEMKSNNYSFIITKTLRSYLEPPFGNCSQYSEENYRPFDATSHMQCYRQCIRSAAKDLFNCVPLFMDDSINELDFPSNDTKLCYNREMKKFKQIEKRLITKCKTYCPKDCLTVDYSYSLRRTDTMIGNEFWHNLNKTERLSKLNLIWDSTQPMLIYREESVMSFTDYLCFCGGLMGLWFGTNAKDLIISLIESQFWLKLWLKIRIFVGKTTPVIELHNN